MNATMRREILERALTQLDDGRAWCRGPLRIKYDDGVASATGRCGILAVKEACPSNAAYTEVSDALMEANPQIPMLPRSPPSARISFGAWNDAPERTFADIKAAFVRAIEAERAKEAAALPLSPCALACAAVVMAGNVALGARL